MNTSWHLVSIIMAAFNSERTIGQAIESVQSQTYPYWELIVVDDSSSDHTASIVREFADRDPRIRLFSNPQNLGASYARKYGLQQAQGAWIAILDSDDIWASEKLEKQIALQQRTGAELLFTGASFIDAGGNSLDWILHVPPTIQYRKLLKQNLISNSSVLVAKELISKYYALDNNIHEDFAAWLNITKTGRCAYGLDEPLIAYRLTHASKSSNKLRSSKMNWNTYRYIGLNVWTAAYYMVWYSLNGLLKYMHLIKF